MNIKLTYKSKLFYALITLGLMTCSFVYVVDTVIPRAAKRPKIFKEHDNNRLDNYYWLANPKNPTVLAHLELENKYADKMLAHIQPLQDRLYKEFSERYMPNENDIPTKIQGFWYYQRYEPNQQYPYICRKKENWDAKEEIIFDITTLAKNKNFFQLRQYVTSNDGLKVCYLYDTIGKKQYTLRIKDIKTGIIFSDTITDVAAKGITWTKDDKAIYYIKNNERVKSYRLMKHVLGTDSAKDLVIYEELDDQNFIFNHISSSRKYMFLNIKNYNHSETRYLDLENPSAKLKLFETRAKDIFYEIDHYEGEEFYIYTNFKASNYRVLKTPLSNTRNIDWKDVIPHKKSSLLVTYRVFKNYIITQHKEFGVDKIRVHSRQDTSSINLDFGEDTFEASFMSYDQNAYDCDSIRITYSSMTVPNTLISYSIKTGKTTYLKQDKVENFVSRNYESKRIWVKSRDNKMIPVSIVYKKSLFKQNGTNPLLLYGYGAYGDNTMSTFRPTVISLLDRGFVYAIAHVRGGSEMGSQWYEDGKLNNKKNTFNDYLDCAHFLNKQKFSDPSRLFAVGGSAGGMLIGAAVNQEPELFKGVVATVPWMDVLNDMMDETLPLTTAEYSEWGNPNEKEAYNYIKSWSPYDNIKAAKYPAIYTTGNLFDNNVPYSSPAKWVQKIRDSSTSNNPVIFKCNLKEGGHTGPSGRFVAFKNISTQYAFLIDLAGIKK
jgi:oligopeptidase B